MSNEKAAATWHGTVRCPECRHLYSGQPLAAGCYCDCHRETR